MKEIWDCPTHGEVMTSTEAVVECLVPPMCPKADPAGRMGVCGKRLRGPIRREPWGTADKTFNPFAPEDDCDADD